jgi:hypothetical protein
MHHAMKETGSVLLFEGFLLRLTVAKTPSPRLGTGGGWAGFAGGGLYLYFPLPSRPRIRSSRGRAGALVGWDGCEVWLSVCPVFVPCPDGVRLPPVSFYRYHMFHTTTRSVDGH